MNGAGAPRGLEAALWDWLEAAGEPGPAGSLWPAWLSGPVAARGYLRVCLDRVLLRDLAREMAAREALEEAPPRELGDAELVAQAIQDLPGAFNVLVERHFSLAVGSAYAVLTNPEQAQEVAQEAFMEAALTLEQLREREKFASWLYGIARRKAINVLRRRKLHREAVDFKREEQRAQPVADDPGVLMDRSERAAAIRQKLAELPEIYREILVLRYLDGRTYQEISGLLGISLTAVDKRLMRAKALLRESLQAWLG